MASRRLAPDEPVNAAEEVEILPHAQFAVERELLRHVAEAAARDGGRAIQIEAIHMRRPGVGFNRPHIILKVVDLPAPFGPSRPKISPRLMLNEMWSAAVKSPKRLVRPTRLDGCPAAVARGPTRRLEELRPLRLAAQHGDERVFETRGDAASTEGVAVSDSPAGRRSHAVPSSITRRTASPWITPSMISGRASARVSSARRSPAAPAHQENPAR